MTVTPANGMFARVSTIAVSRLVTVEISVAYTRRERHANAWSATEDMPMKYDVISADCHIDLIWLPPDLFTDNAPAAMKDRMPFVTDGRSAARSG